MGGRGFPGFFLTIFRMSLICLSIQDEPTNPAIDISMAPTAIISGQRSDESEDKLTTQKFSKGEAVRFGWDTTKRYIGFFIGLVIVYAALIYVPPIFIAEAIWDHVPVLSITVRVAYLVLSAIIGLGFIRITLRLYDHEKTGLSDLFSCYPLFLSYLLSSFLYGLIVLCGTILFIIPGVIWSIKFYFYPYFIIDQGCGPLEALKKSAAITRDSMWDLFLFGLMLAGITLLGLLAVFIGLIAAYPTVMLATAYVYRRLNIQSDYSTD